MDIETLLAKSKDDWNRWCDSLILYNQEKKGLKEKTSLHVSSMNSGIERPESIVRNNLKQSAALLYCEKWWWWIWLQRWWEILWCKRSQSRVTRFTGLKSELKLDASRIRHFGSTEENWARIKIFSSKCHGFSPWLWEKHAQELGYCFPWRCIVQFDIAQEITFTY